jgi:hypothetical protein
MIFETAAISFMVGLAIGWMLGLSNGITLCQSNHPWEKMDKLLKDLTEEK